MVWFPNSISHWSGPLKEIKPGAQSIICLGNLESENNEVKKEKKEKTRIGHEDTAANFSGPHQPKTKHFDH